MYNIKFFQEVFPVKKKIVNKQFSDADFEIIEKELEKIRDRKPHIFNIETTNYCNMKCVMCPRTIYMTRKNIWISDEMFENLLDKITPYKKEDIENFWKWVENNYEYSSEEVSENGFYFSVISRCLVLHGYGEPFLDKYLIKRLELCKKKNIPTYFSCTPATMTIDKAVAAMEAGLSVLKFSIDALEDESIKKIRGKKANYTESIQKILKLIEIKKEKNFKTLFVPCMIALGNSEKDKEMQKKFLDFWADKGVFAYIKSQDNRWLFEQDTSLENKSHYAKQYCEFPWTSLTVMADGNVVPCTQISNNEIVLGNVNENTIEEIWNSEKYREFRKMHITGNFPKNHKCSKNCDQIKLYEYIKKPKKN